LKDTTPIKLREGQEDVISGCIAEMKKNYFGGAIAQVVTGGGKTIIGIELARRLGIKTLVIAHNTLLLKQWPAEVRRFFPEWDIGIIQGNKIDVKDKDICIGTLQSLALKDDYPDWLFEEFGLIIIDEVHKVAAAEFQKAMIRFNAKYMLGLSGTLKRADGAENIFKYGIGIVVSGMNKVKVMDPTIYFISTQYAWNVGKNRPLDRQKIGLLKGMIESNARNEIIIRNACKAAMSGRNVLVCSERVGHVTDIAYEIAKRVKPRGIDVGILVGSTKEEKRIAARKAQVICATYQLIGTGFNEPRMDTLIMGTPISAVEQPVGRILRCLDEKKDPIVLDIIDKKSFSATKMGNSRRRKYKEKGWKIVNDNLFDRWDYCIKNNHPYPF
jgi:superfamily II DNA or RNA helicase